MNKAIVRIIQKYSNSTGVVPTIPTSSDHTDGTWLNTDIYPGELFVNTADEILYTRIGSDIITIGNFASGTLNTLSDVDITGLADGYQLQWDDYLQIWVVVDPLWIAGVGTGSVLQNNGSSNEANGARSVAIGQGCRAEGDTSIAMGGSCIANEDFSRAVGSYAVADDERSEVFSSGDFGTDYRSQYGRAVMMVSTEASSPTKALLGSQDHIKINQDHSYHFSITAVAMRNDGTAAYTRGTEHCLVKDIAGTTTIVDTGGFPVLLALGDAALAAIYIDVAVDSGKFCIIVVDDTLDDLLINWTIFVEWTVVGCEQA